MVLTQLVPKCVRLLRLNVRVYDASSRYFHYPLSTNKLLVEPDLRRENPLQKMFWCLSKEPLSRNQGRSLTPGCKEFSCGGFAAFASY